MNFTLTRTLVIASVAFFGSSCKNARHELNVHPTSATVEVLHTDVTVTTGSQSTSTPRIRERIEIDGRVATGSAGRAIVRTDDGLELRMAGDSELRFTDGRARLDHGRVFVSSWGDSERTLEVGSTLTLGVGDASIEAERTTSDDIRVITVRGEIAWRQTSSQGRLQQGEALVGHGTPTVHAAAVWDDWTGGAASPQGAAQRGALGTGNAVIHGDDGEAPMPLAVNEHRVSVRVEGDLAITTVSQRFFNGSDRTAPVEYQIRLPDGAMVSNFLVDRDGGILTATPGVVASLAPQGGRAALLAHPNGGLFARLDPLAPGQTVRCELVYVEWLLHESGHRTYTYPMGDPISPPFEGDFSFEISAAHANVSALRGPAGSLLEGTRLRYLRSDFRPRADLIVDLFDASVPNTPSARLWRSIASNQTEFALIDVSLPPPEDPGTDLVVLVDDSAGTTRGALNIARGALDALVHLAGPRDRIALYFGDVRGRPASGTAGELGSITPERREAMLDAIAHATPGGATDLQSMLADAYARLDPRRNGSVVYLGDAMPTTGALDSDRLIEETLRVAPDLRLYVVALGTEAHPEVLQRIARRGGLTLRAMDQAEAVTAAHRIAAHAVRPVYRDVTLHLGATIAHPLPEVLPEWVAGDPIRVAGELVGSEPSEVTIDARTLTGVQHWTTPLAIDTIQDLGDIRRRWASARIAALEGLGASNAALADLGVRYGLITRTSALVLGAPDYNPTGDGNIGFPVAASLWPDEALSWRLPRLGLDGGEIDPRGIQTIYEPEEYPIVIDDESGWTRHFLGENAQQTGVLEYALMQADPSAQACIDRTRSVRPRLAGDVTVAATVAADGRVTTATVTSTSLADAGTESCIRRAVAGLVLPPPSLFGVLPGTVSHTFSFPVAWVSPRVGACPVTSRLSRAARTALWRERIANNRNNLGEVYTQAMWRCELRVWEDRMALLTLLVRSVADPSELVSLRVGMEKEAQYFLDREVARRWGASRLWRAYAHASPSLNWDALMRRLADPAVAIAQKIQLAEAYRLLVPWDIDLRLRLMSLYEQAGRVREARRTADDLRGDPYSDTRVRALVGEMLIRTGDRDEGQRALSEMVEFAPYDTGAREQLGDLLITYGGETWAQEAYLQYRTLASLREGDPLPRVKMAMAATLAHREDEALRILRGIAEDSSGDASATTVEALLVFQVAKLAATRGADPAVRGWMRVASLMSIARTGGVLAQWTHPDVALELRAFQPGDTGFTTIEPNGSPLSARLFTPGSLMEGSRLLVRASIGLNGARTVTAHVSILQPGQDFPRLFERDVVLTAQAPVVALAVRNGILVDDPTPIPDVERVAPNSEIY